MTMLQRPLRSTRKRAHIIQQIEEVCKELSMPILVDLNCYTYAELVFTNVRLQLGKKARRKASV
ncbi:hypothetical protein LCGC14_1316840 [marine sediment metagenome]|uniref:Uncharacterized protein n=1 Tax=marine sediment metagenome TaxID=412755 RepID=A0A0F9NMY7_9ZZZZ